MVYLNQDKNQELSDVISFNISDGMLKILRNVPTEDGFVKNHTTYMLGNILGFEWFEE